MPGVIATIPKFQFQSNGIPIVDGTLETYISGSTTSATTWQDAAQSIANTNPIVLDSRGECVLWLDPLVVYKFVLKSKTGVTLWTVSDITGPLAGSFAVNLAAGNGATLVGFLQAGTGAIARTAQAKMRERVSVDDFGAVGDGTTNDQVAIQAAANAAIGKVLYFTPGKRYVVGTGFNFNGDNSHISGYGATLVYGQTAFSYQHCIRISGNDVSVRGIKIETPSALVRDNTGFAISVGTVGTPTSSAVVADCTIDGTASAGIWFSAVRIAVATGNIVRNCKADGIHFSDDCFSINCENNSLTNNGDDQIAVVNDSAGAPFAGNFIISGNVITLGTAVGTSAGHGIALVGAMSGVVCGNFITGTIEPAIGTYQFADPTNLGTNLLIDGNSITNCGTGGDFKGCGINLQFSSRVVVSNNIIQNLVHDVVKISGGIRVTAATDLVITDNKFDNNACDGIVVTNATTALTIHDNMFGFMLRTPILVSGTVGKASICGNVSNSNASATDISVTLPSTFVLAVNNIGTKAVSITSSNTNAITEVTSTAFVPTVTAGTGSLTSASANLSYQRSGNYLYVSATVSIVNNGTGLGGILISLPFSGLSGAVSGRDVTGAGKAVTGWVLGSNLAIYNYDASHPGVNGVSFVLSGVLKIG